MGYYFDDVEPDQTFETGGVTLTESAIIDFALVYDPQYFHVDKPASANSIFGDIVASGFQVLAISFRLILDCGALKHNMGGNGADEVRWLKPVKPGDTLRCSGRFIEKRPSKSRQDRGNVRILYTTTNQHGEPVLTFILNHIFKAKSGDRA